LQCHCYRLLVQLFLFGSNNVFFLLLFRIWLQSKFLRL
jgi:hypothetical protein